MTIPTTGGSKVYKITLEKLIEAQKRRIKQKDKGTDEEYYRNLVEEFLKGSRYYKYLSV